MQLAIGQEPFQDFELGSKGRQRGFTPSNGNGRCLVFQLGSSGAAHCAGKDSRYIKMSLHNASLARFNIGAALVDVANLRCRVSVRSR